MAKVQVMDMLIGLVVIAYGEWYWICDLQSRRFSFGTRNQAWSLKSFCVAEFVCLFVCFAFEMLFYFYEFLIGNSHGFGYI